MDDKHLANRHEVCVGEDSTEKLKFMVADLPFDICRARNDAYATYVVSGMEYMKYLASAMDDVIKPAKNDHVLRSTVQCFLV